MAQYAPVRTADLNSWYPLGTAGDAAFDYSGNARTLTLAGALTTVAGPPGAAALVTAEDTPVSGVVHAIDPDGDPLTYALVAGTTNGTITLDPISGAFTYAPFSGVTGVDTFIFKASDGLLDSNVMTVTLLVTPNRVPA